jgi:hypothetical protein
MSKAKKNKEKKELGGMERILKRSRSLVTNPDFVSWISDMGVERCSECDAPLIDYFVYGEKAYLLCALCGHLNPFDPENVKKPEQAPRGESGRA